MDGRERGAWSAIASQSDISTGGEASEGPSAAWIEERLRAYIRPNEPATSEQEAALAEAVEAQLAWEREIAGEALPPGVQSLRIGDYSVQAGERSGAADSRESICPAAWAILVNAGLLKRTWPVAQKL